MPTREAVMQMCQMLKQQRSIGPTLNTGKSSLQDSHQRGQGPHTRGSGRQGCKKEYQA